MSVFSDLKQKINNQGAAYIVLIDPIKKIKI